MRLTRLIRKSGLVCASLLSFTLSARAQDDNETDPTEPSRGEPLVSIPMPGDTDAPAADPTDAEATAAADAKQDKNGDEPTSNAAPGDPWGDAAEGGLLSLRVLFQMRYESTFAVHSTSARQSIAVREDYLMQKGDGWALNRLFLRVGSDPSPYVGFKAIIDFAELFDDDPEDSVKQAYATIRMIPKHLELVVGLFKLPFSTIELDASSRWEFANFGETDRLIGDLGFGGRDLGMQLLVAPLRKAKRLRISLGAFKGHSDDEHDTPIGAVGGRIETKPNKHLRFGADMVQHTKEVVYNRPLNTSNDDELPNPPNPLYPAQKHWGRGRAMSADARYKGHGLMLRGEVQYGDRVDINERYGAETFWAAWGIAAYTIDFGSWQLLPAVRYEFLDADREHDVGIQHQLSGALTFLFLERVRFVLDVTRNDVQAGTARINQPKPLPEEPYQLLDHVRGVAQLQVEL